MRIQALFFILICISSLSFSQEPIEKKYDTFNDFLVEQNDKIAQLSNGLSLTEVKEIMGPPVTVIILKAKNIKALNQLFKQPESLNKYKGNPKITVDILWYFSTPKDQNGLISKSECTPILFENGFLVGKGWGFFKKYRKTGNLR